MKYLARFFVWLAKKCGAQLAVRPNEEYIEVAKGHVAHVSPSSETWEWKQRQCIRALMNRYPEARVRDLNLAIEIAVQECSEAQ